MAEPTALEKGRIGAYPAETPDFGKKAEGKGVTVKMGSHPDRGTPMPLGIDKHATILKQTWGKAMSAAKKFGNF